MPSRRRGAPAAEGEAIGELPIPGEFSVSVECTVVGGGATFSITVRMGNVCPPLISARSNWMVSRAFGLVLVCACASVTCPTMRDPFGMTIPSAVVAFSVVFTITGSPALAFLVSIFFSSSPVTGRSCSLLASGARRCRHSAPAAGATGAAQRAQLAARTCSAASRARGWMQVAVPQSIRRPIRPKPGPESES